MFIFSFFCFLIIFALLVSLLMPGFLNDMNVGFYLIIIIAFALAGFTILLRKNFSFFRTLSIYICGFLTLFVIVEGVMVYFSKNDLPSGKEQAIIVSGSGLFVESRLSTELERRLDVAIELYTKNPNLPIILSGGTDENRALPECVAMKSYLKNKVSELGLALPSIITEEKSTTIYQNVKNSLETEDFPSAYIIVSRHNIARTKIISKRISPESTVIGADYPYSKYIIYYIREFGFTLKSFLLDSII